MQSYLKHPQNQCSFVLNTMVYFVFCFSVLFWLVDVSELLYKRRSLWLKTDFPKYYFYVQMLSILNEADTNLITVLKRRSVRLAQSMTALRKPKLDVFNSSHVLNFLNVSTTFSAAQRAKLLVLVLVCFFCFFNSTSSPSQCVFADTPRPGRSWFLVDAQNIKVSL